MDRAGMRTEMLGRMTRGIASRVMRNNVMVALAGVAICLLMGQEAALGFGAGFLAATANLYMLFGTARASVGMEPERAKSFVTRRYPVRFFLTSALVLLIVWKMPLGAWAVLAAFTATLMTAVLTLIYIARSGDGEALFNQAGAD